MHTIPPPQQNSKNHKTTHARTSYPPMSLTYVTLPHPTKIHLFVLNLWGLLDLCCHLSQQSLLSVPVPSQIPPHTKTTINLLVFCASSLLSYFLLTLPSFLFYFCIPLLCMRVFSFFAVIYFAGVLILLLVACVLRLDF